MWTGRELVIWGGQIGTRLSLDTVGDGTRFRPYWLETLAPTEVTNLFDELLRTAEAGEWYRVADRNGGYALVAREDEGGDGLVWIPLDERVVWRSPY